MCHRVLRGCIHYIHTSNDTRERQPTSKAFGSGNEVLFCKNGAMDFLGNLCKRHIPGDLQQWDMNLVRLIARRLGEMFKKVGNGQTNASQAARAERTNEGALLLLSTRPGISCREQKVPWPHPGKNIGRNAFFL